MLRCVDPPIAILVLVVCVRFDELRASLSSAEAQDPINCLFCALWDFGMS